MTYPDTVRKDAAPTLLSSPVPDRREYVRLFASLPALRLS